MLTNQQLLLAKTAEEASEVQKECLKGQVYGIQSMHNGERNCDLIREEVLDLLVCIRRLEKAGIIRRIKPSDVSKHFYSKRPKIVRRTVQAIKDEQIDPECYALIPEYL